MAAVSAVPCGSLHCQPDRLSTGRLGPSRTTSGFAPIVEAGLLPCDPDRDAGTQTKSLLPHMLADRETARDMSTEPKCLRSLKIPSGAWASEWTSVDIEFRGNAIRSCFWLWNHEVDIMSTGSPSTIYYYQ